MVASFNRDNKMIAHQIQEMQARQKPGTEPASTTEFRIPVTIPGGTTRVRVIVRDTVTGKMGTADLAPAAFAGK
jgi:hypothetical protein